MHQVVRSAFSEQMQVIYASAIQVFKCSQRACNEYECSRQLHPSLIFVEEMDSGRYNVTHAFQIWRNCACERLTVIKRRRAMKKQCRNKAMTKLSENQTVVVARYVQHHATAYNKLQTSQLSTTNNMSKINVQRGLRNYIAFYRRLCLFAGGISHALRNSKKQAQARLQKKESRVDSLCD